MISENLSRKIAVVREGLLADPEGLIAGDLKAGTVASAPSGASAALAGYYDFLVEVDGARCGSIDLWSSGELRDKQYVVQSLPGGRESWVSIGQVLYEPLVLNLESGKVSQVSGQPTEDAEIRELETLETFLDEFVFGPRYAEIVPDADQEEWFQLLEKLALL